MLRSILIDDEEHCILSLKRDLELHCPTVEVLATAFSAKEGILLTRKLKPDLIFLDVEMPWMNGFEMLEVLGNIDCMIIFTTAHDEFAAKAFRISAVDFLLKPIDASDLKEAVSKAEIKLRQGIGVEHITTLLKNIRQPFANQKIALPHRDGFEFVEVMSIFHCHAEGSYTKVFLEGKRCILVSRILGEIEELLPQEIFQRVHHSTVINVRHVIGFIRKDGGYVVLENGEKLAVSKSRKEMLLAKLGLKG